MGACIACLFIVIYLMLLLIFSLIFLDKLSLPFYESVAMPLRYLYGRLLWRPIVHPLRRLAADYPELARFVKLIFALLFCAVITHYPFLWLVDYMNIKNFYILSFDSICAVGIAYVIGSIFLMVFYQRIYGVLSIYKVQTKYRIGAEAIILSTYVSMIFHYAVLYLVYAGWGVEIPLVMLRVFGFAVDLSVYTAYCSFMVRNLHVNLSVRRFGFWHTNIDDT